MLDASASRTSALTLVRTFAASASAVYAAWTEADQVRRWWGPHGFSCHRAEMDVRPGGSSLVGMRAPAEWGGAELLTSWSYRQVRPSLGLEFVMRFVDRAGQRVTPASLGLPAGVPDQVLHTLSFVELGGGCSELTIVESGYTTAAAIDTSRAGLVQSLDKLGEALRQAAVAA